MSIGNGVKWTYFGRMIVTGTEAVPLVKTVFNSVNFPLLTFGVTPDGLYDFDPASGVFTFKRKGLVDIAATINLDAGSGVTLVEFLTDFDEGAGFVKRNARVAELETIGQQQTVLEGTLEEVNKGDKVRFDVRSNAPAAEFKTQVLGDGSVVPAIILHMKMWTR